MSRNTRWLLIGGTVAGLIAVLVVAALTFAGPNRDLDGTHWTVTQINGRPAVAGSAVVDLRFLADHQIGGHAGCNMFGGKYTNRGRALSFSDLISTMMACADDALNLQESAYLQALDRVAGYDLAGDTLTLTDANGTAVLVFARA